MTTRSLIDLYTVLVPGLPVKTKAKPIVTLSSDVTDPFQSGVGAAKDEQAIFNEDPVSSKQQVDESVFEPIEFDDTADLKLDDTAEVTINKSVVSELYPNHSPSNIDENDVLLDTVSHLNTIEECMQIISKLRHREKALHLINTGNKKNLGCLQTDAVGARHLFEKKHIEQERWEGEYHRYFQEVQRLDKEGDKNHRTIKELNELVQYLKETSTEITDRSNNK